METGTHPGPWFLEDEATVMTVVDVLEKRSEAVKAKTKTKPTTRR